MNTRRWLGLAPLLLALIGGPATAASSGLDGWATTTMVPTVSRILSSHVRFRGETVRFVVFDDGAPAASSNALAIALRDQLAEAAVTTSGIRVASASPAPGQAIDCTRDDADYLVGVEITRGIGNAASVVVRALDIGENSWVGGFAVDWRGSLSRDEQRALATPRTDPGMRGARTAPFDASERDLLARHLARKLSCQLLRGGTSDYVIEARAGSAPGDATHWDKTLDLARRHMSAHDAVGLTTDDARATARLAGSAHEIGGGLYEYWLTVVPDGEDDDLETLSASAYVRLGPVRLAGQPPEAQSAPTPAPVPVVALPGGRDAALLGPLTLAVGGSGNVLRTTARADAIVFFIQYEPGKGMVRLGDRNCRARTIARLARAGESLAFPVGDRPGVKTSAGELPEWHMSPSANTYFAIAISDTRLARRVAGHVDHLPMRCGRINPRGLEHQALSDWLDELAALTEDAHRNVAWRAVETRDVL